MKTESGLCCLIIESIMVTNFLPKTISSGDKSRNIGDLHPITLADNMDSDLLPSLVSVSTKFGNVAITGCTW